MAVSSGSPPQRPREPAWKRLGLKLKYAKESSEPQPAKSSETSTADSTDRQLANDSPLPSKKRKRHDTAANAAENSVVKPVVVSSESQPVHNEHDTAPDAKPMVGREDHELQLTDDNRSKQDPIFEKNLADDIATTPRRKSVTFADDTKQEDENSGSVQERSANQNIPPDEPTNTSSGTKQSKKQKKRASKSTSSSTSSNKNSQSFQERRGSLDEHTPEYIAYLQLFHTNRSSWKFNKNNQKGLLKNLFRIDCISQEHNEAILDYISGLQGAAAKQRIIESATSVLRELAEKDGDLDKDSKMESEEARRNAYSASLQRHLEKYERAKLHRDEYDDLQVEEMKQEVERGKRADALLRQLLEQELRPERTSSAPQASESSRTLSGDTTSQTASTSSTTPTSTSKAGSKRKRRKARTQASSDDSSSSSDTSESEGDFNPKRGPATVHDALRVRSSPQLKNHARNSNSPQPVVPKRKIFDDELLDQIFPKKQHYYDTAPKRKPGERTKPRGFAYTHGTKADESASEDE